MTLETYLKKAGAVTEEDIRVPGGVVEVAGATTGNYGMEGLMNYGMQNCPSGGFGVEGFGNGMVGVGGSSGGAVVVASVGGGRGKRRAVEEVPLDKATQQKQKRMIKNRESAARSRERKQAYTVELEALVTKLEEENARLIKEEAELKKQRLKQLIEKVKPVVEERRTPKAVMRRTRSMTW
ncbi:basic leucine zipper transcription factor [Lithospermum erythrorhizon]|uniref:Basic leucine zipper transcription factor n=1 Tax=Lithospermum erythrorhizon TaxID=34254 RepID=A0AAV3PFC2_LITER